MFCSVSDSQISIHKQLLFQLTLADPFITFSLYINYNMYIFIEAVGQIGLLNVFITAPDPTQINQLNQIRGLSGTVI